MQPLEVGDNDDKKIAAPLEIYQSKLLRLPSELIFEIVKYISSDDDLSCLVRTCRRTHFMLNAQLYKRSFEGDNFAILWAAKKGSTSTVQRALSIATDVNVKANGFIKLVTDISRRRRSPTVHLVQVCYEIHDKSPLILAAENNRIHVIQLLLSVPWIRIDATAFGMAAIHWAALKGHARAVELLLPYNKHFSVLGRTPLHLAASNGHAKIVSLLLGKRHEEVNATDPFGQTALHLAARNGHTEIVKKLLQHSNINALQRDGRGHTASQLAIKHQRIWTAAAILKHCRANANNSDRHDLGSLHVRARMACRRRATSWVGPLTPLRGLEEQSQDGAIHTDQLL